MSRVKKSVRKQVPAELPSPPEKAAGGPQPPQTLAPAAGAGPEAGPGAGPEAPPEQGFPIVGIGASAGGLAAFEAFFSAMPTDKDTGMAFVLVQHLAPDHKSILSDLVKRYTRMQVFEVEDGMAVKPNCAYIIPPNRDMALLKGSLQLLAPTAPRGLRHSIDFFFRSLAQDQRERAICIVLSGTGSDGTLGLRAVKGEGGMAMAQNPESTEHDGMPRSAIATGLVDYVLPPAEMPAQLVAYVAHAFGRSPRPVSEPPPKAQDALRKICVLLRSQTGHDFSNYKENTIVRRVERRMALHRIERPDDYVHYLQQSPAEVKALFRDLLIGVTNFFRDPEAFAALQSQVIPRLFAGKPAGWAVRVWVCGCSTGEEAYSIAILIQEHLETLKQTFKVQVFATDVDKQAIEQARNGVFPPSIAADVPAERLARFFTQDSGGAYRIQKGIRDLMVFSEQDVIKDPPFSKLDLISCRNLLIYLNGDLQRKLIPLFHYALNLEGLLFLGTSETVGEFTPLFDAVDRKWRIYARRKDVFGAPRPVLGDFIPLLAPGRPRRPLREEGQEKANFRALTEQSLLEHYVQAGVLINGQGEILHIYGRTGKYLEPAPGDAGMNILSMAREGLRSELATALHKAVAHRELARHSALRVRTNGEFITVNLTVQPVAAPRGEAAVPELFLVIFEEAPPASVEPPVKDAAAGGDAPTESDRRIAYLEQELRAKEEYLQTTLEEMETSNEELKSTNEEMQSVNEELQSTNEELETSKEELQSVNEELATVNAELQAKVNDLSRANNDMNNLLAGTGVGTLFVDLELRISRFTPAATQVINLIQTDIGRPVGHIVSNLVGYDHLVQDVKTVLDTLAPREAEVQTKEGAWYLMRIWPYRTTENVIEGAVLTFVDITERKRVEEALRESLRRFSLFTAVAGDLLLTPDPQELVEALCRRVMEHLDCQVFLSFLVDEKAGRLRLNACAGIPQEEARRSEWMDYGEGLCGCAARDGRLIVAENIFTTPDPRTELVKSYGLRACACHPLLRTDGKVIGTLSFGARTRDKFSDADLSLMKAVSGHVAAAMARVKSHEALRQSKERLSADLDAMTRLQRIGMLFVGESGVQAVLEQILESAVAIAGADMGNLQLLDPGSGSLKSMAQRGFEQSFLDSWDRVHAGQGACGEALKRGERVIVEDLTRSAVFAGTPALDAQLAAGVRAVQSTPLVSRSGKALGVLSTHFKTPRRPTEETLRLLDLLARQTADILERFQAEAELRRGPHGQGAEAQKPTTP